MEEDFNKDKNNDLEKKVIEETEEKINDNFKDNTLKQENDLFKIESNEKLNNSTEKQNETTYTTGLTENNGEKSGENTNNNENISNNSIDDDDDVKPRKKMKKKTKSFIEWTYCIIIAIVLALLFRYYIGTPTMVKQVSMYPTLEQNQRLWLNRWGRTTHTLPNRGDIITFEEPKKISYSQDEIDIEHPIAEFYEREGWDWFVNNFLEMGDKRSYIKRVIGLPGEHIQIKDGKVYINGEEFKEDYLQPGVVTDVVGVGFDDFIVPENCVFAMGDNRNRSTDCRSFGCVPLEKIESTVAFRFWPLDKFGEIEAVK